MKNYDEEFDEDFAEDLEQKYQELIVLSNQIIELYNQLLTSLINNEEALERKPILKELRKLINEEDKIIQAIPKQQLNDYLDSINPIFEEDDLNDTEDTNQDEENKDVSDRIIHKLIQETEIYDNNFIPSYILCLRNAPQNKQLSAIDAINTIITLKTIQSLKEQFSILIPSNKQEYDIIISLKRELDAYLIDTLMTYSTAEFIALYNDTDINQFPKTSIEIIKLFISFNYKNLFENVIEVCTKETINLLTNSIDYNSPSSIFEYKKLTTRLDILLFYTSSDLYPEIEEYVKIAKFTSQDTKKEVEKILKKHKGKGRTKQQDNNKD